MNEYIKSFETVWSFCTERSFPFIFRKTDPVSVSMLPLNSRMMFPAVGLFLGVILVLAAYVVGFAGRIPQLFVSFFVLPYLSEFLVSDKSLHELSAYMLARKSGCDQDEALDSAADNSYSENHFSYFVLFLLRGAFMAGLIYFGSAFWLPVTYVCSYLVRAELSSVIVSGTDNPYIAVSEHQKNWHWILSAVLVLLVSLGDYQRILGSFFAFGCCWGISWYFSSLCMTTSRGMSKKMMNVFGT